MVNHLDLFGALVCGKTNVVSWISAWKQSKSLSLIITKTSYSSRLTVEITEYNLHVYLHLCNPMSYCIKKAWTMLIYSPIAEITCYQPIIRLENQPHTHLQYLRSRRWALVASAIYLLCVHLDQLEWLEFSLYGNSYWQSLLQENPVYRVKTDSI